jgi:DNA-binding winged helix-turn-helix (wHTH) protein/tetratricopeptide (TPR) repeat protein
MRYTFGAYTLDMQRYELCQAGLPVQLQPKVFDLLAYLLQHRDRAVTRQELFDTLWPEHLVSDDALEWIVAAARRAVGDSGRAQRVIQTVRSRGYRWVAPVAVHASVLPDTEGLTPAAHAPGATDHAAMLSPVAGERKQVTVLAGILSPVVAQAAGMEPETLYTVQQRVFTVAQQAVRHYAGTLQSVVDHAFLAVFGAPVAQEDHARRAVLAALHIQESLRPLNATLAPGTGQEWAVCLGMHTGEAIVGAIGDDLHQIVVTVGDTTQVAHALLRLAEPGAILRSAATSRLVRDFIRLERVSPANVPGATAPQAVYKVLDLAPPTAVGWQGRRVVRQFVGRVPEMATLQALLAQVVAGHGQVVGLAGEPGIGKSRLLYEFRQRVRQRSCTSLLGRCVSYGQATPYLPLLDLVRQACGVSERDTPEVTAARVRQVLQRIGLEPAERAPYVLRLLNLPDRLAPVEPLSPGELRTRIFTTLLQMQLAASQQRPLLLAVEDVHWIDPTSAEWLMQLVERLVSAPILLLVSYRSGYQPAWLSKSYATQLALPRLTADDSRRIVQTVLPARLVSDGLVQTIVTSGEGNPFFLEELAQTVVDRGDSSPTLALPETVQAVLAARLDRLPPEAKALAQVAAVIGTEVPGVLLQAVTTLADTTLQHHLAPLRDAELLYEARSVPAPVYAFKHALTHEVAYQSLLRSTRQHYHRQVADVLVTRFADRVETQPEVVAHHYTEAGLPAQALPYWQRAGDRAAEQSAHREAIVHCTRGLAVLTMLPETRERTARELHLQVRLGITQMALDGFGAPSAQHTLERARALGPQVADSPYFPMVFRALATSYFFQGQLSQAQAMAERLLDLSQRIGSRWHGQGAHLQLGQVAYRLGELTAARAHGESALTLSDPKRDGSGVEMGVDMRVDIRAHLALCLWDLGYPDQARARVQEALVLARQRAHPLSLALALLRAAYIQAQCGAWQEVQTHAETLLRLATDLGLTWFRAYALHARGHALAAQGHTAAGIAQMQQGLVALQGHGEPYQAYVRACLAEVYGRNGQAEAGLALLAEALADLPDGRRLVEAHLSVVQGELLLVRAPEQQAAAARCFYQAMAIAHQQQAKGLELRAALRLSRLWQRQGKHQEAHKLLAPVYEWFTEGFDTADLQEAQALLHQLSGKP